LADEAEVVSSLQRDDVIHIDNERDDGKVVFLGFSLDVTALGENPDKIIIHAGGQRSAEPSCYLKALAEKMFQRISLMWYSIVMTKVKPLLFLLLIGAGGCATSGAYTPGATLLLGLQHYQGEMQRLNNSPSRWPQRQQLGGELKTVITATVGGSAEFYRLVDLDLRKREFMITMRETSLRPDRLQEMKDELVEMNQEVAALKPIIRTETAVLPVRRDAQQRIEGVATAGLLNLALDAFSSNRASGLDPPSTRVDQYVITDLGSFSTVRTPEGQTFRCALFGTRDEGAGIKCDPIK
jgi:hypothetical protein